MIYWYTGQPGHGKSMHAIERAMAFVKAGRVVYAVNVKGLDYERTGILPMTVEQFIDWPNFLPDGAVCLVDECYQYGMLPKRPPGSKVPAHVDELARHRHRGLDFIFVSQSPSKQCDDFVADLIEEQVHVRRMFGTPFVRLKIFDRHERSPDKATPLTIKRQTLNRKSKGLYQSTVLDTSERRIPWYFWLFGALLVGVPIYAWWTWGNMKHRFLGDDKPAQAADVRGNGARSATVPKQEPPPLRERDFAAWMRPRIPGQPWTAAAYDKLEVPREPPRVFCMSSGRMVGKAWVSESCSCITDQGTTYVVEHSHCATIARNGQYEPFLVTADDSRGVNTRGEDQYRQWSQERARASESKTSGQPFGSVAAYGKDALGAY